MLPEGCALIGVEIDKTAVELPSFRHPRRAAYVLGMERIGLTQTMIECCDYLVKIPTKFSLNLATAGGILMYDRMLTMRRFADRPVVTSGKAVKLDKHVFGTPITGRGNNS